MIAAATTNDAAVWWLIILCLIGAALAAAAIAGPVARRAVQRMFDREHQDWLDSLDDDPAPPCPAVRDGGLIPGHCVSLDGHLFGLCPGCGKANVSCTIVDPNLPFGPWMIDDHEPRIDPDLGLHGGECWANKVRTDDYGLCVCARVSAGEF